MEFVNTFRTGAAVSHPSRLATLVLAVLVAAAPVSARAESANVGTGDGSISGIVTIGDDKRPVEHARVTISPGGTTVFTEADGHFAFTGLAAGRYTVVAHIERIDDRAIEVVVTENTTESVEINLLVSGIREEVTVTASGQEEITSNSIQAVTVIGSDQLATRNPVSLGEALDHELGIAKRSYGPGNARPVVRGFDGDRVLILQDGMKIGALGFQSGDHSEPVDVLGLERIEIVRGPATLLYGSSAIGGVVNAVQGHETAQPGVRGYLTGVLSSNNSQASGNGGVEFGTQNWLFYFGGGGNSVDDYETPLGTVPNSYVTGGGVTVGGGWYGAKAWINGGYVFDRREYGVPYDTAEEDPEIVFLDPRRHSLAVRGGFRDTGAFIDAGRFSFQVNDYRHAERDAATGEIGTLFNNDVVVYRGVVDHARRGILTGSLGIEGSHRDYESIGAEALAPPTTQNQFAVFGLETLDFERAVLQLGGRIERNAYDSMTLEDRSFTGFSGAIGVRVPLPRDFSVVANFSSSYRAPALEELYNFGPHPGNLAFEIGDVDLERERSTGFDVGVRHASGRVRFEANAYVYRISNFIYLAPTDEVEDGFVVANFAGADSRFAGFEAKADIELHEYFNLGLGLDYTRAEIRDTETPLPRIPPLRGRAALDFLYKGFRVTPEVIFSDRQDRVFTFETETAGYATFQLGAGYTWVGSHVAHVVSVEGFNLTDRLYQNHLSFIKNIAPEIGRGVRIAYTFKFF